MEVCSIVTELTRLSLCDQKLSLNKVRAYDTAPYTATWYGMTKVPYLGNVITELPPFADERC